MLTVGHEPAAPELEPRQAEPEDHHGPHEADPRGRETVGAEELSRDQVLDLRRARQGRHGEREDAQGDGARDQSLRDVRHSEQFAGQGEHHERHHEEADAAVGHQGGGDHGGRQGVPRADPAGHRAGDRLGIAGDRHQHAEHGTEQEQREVLAHESGEGRHEDLRVGGENRRSGEHQGHDGRDRRRDDDGHAPVRQGDQQGEGQDDANDPQDHSVLLGG
ncbi:hypothetical protein ACFFX0_24220 [Citricoccus parietis]|uniref:Uncharacterized protein n=1 Tax=Citricoccus parietis TaxID=592307 RepID=A0ABV5G5A5_9MICC